MKKFTFSIFILLFALLVGGLLWWANGTKAENIKDTTEHSFVIAKGEGTRQIGNDLKSQGFISDPIIFYLLVRLNGYDGKIQAGNFQLLRSQTPSEILATLIKGEPGVMVLIKEGQRATEIAEILQSKMPQYSLSWKNQLIQNEGYLFPDTYSFTREETIDQIIATLRSRFDEQYQQASTGATVKYSQQEAVTLASLVQREGKSKEDMKNVASVLENRLGLGMALQVDASVQYIIGNSFNWWPTPTSNNLAVASAYNTYKNPGLPPAPISNPGLDALTAVLHPANTNYLYYFTDGKGITHYAKTLDEQNANIAKFGL